MLILFMHMFRGSSATNPFDIQSLYIYIEKWMYVVINYQKGEIESAIMPLTLF